MPPPRISVVIPAYNRAGTIGYCLDSVCSQTLPPFEVIVVDDCSTDSTVETVNEYGRSHPNVRCVVLERNSGAQAARNRGIREARGEWIAFQDSDDEWMLDKLEKQVEALAAVGFEPLTVVHTDAWSDDNATGIRTVWHLPLCEGRAYARLLSDPAPLFPTFITSKTALEQIGLLDEKVPSYQEWDTSIRLAKQCRFIHIREPLFVYHFHAGETISKNKKRDIEGYQFIVDKHRAQILEQCGPGALTRHIEQNALKAMRWGLYAEAREILARDAESSARGMMLKWMARMKIHPALYDGLLGWGLKARRLIRRFGFLKKE